MMACSKGGFLSKKNRPAGDDFCACFQHDFLRRFLQHLYFMRTKTEQHVFEWNGTTWYSNTAHMSIDIYVGVPELLIAIKSRFFLALRFGDQSCEHFVRKRIEGSIFVRTTYYLQ